ncbi:MAG: RAD55 family ATPase, partial [Thermomicrobiales bacterium]
MTARQSTEEHPSQPRLSTGISGLDAILGGGLPIRRTTLVAGQIGTGKTTLSNQIAFHHARKGGTVLVATLLNESHDLLLQNLSTFRFFQEDLVGGSIRYINVLTALIEEGLEATTTMLWQEVRRTGANLLVVDGTSIIQDLTPSAFDLRQFAQQLESHCAMLGCTALLLTSYLDDALRLLGG